MESRIATLAHRMDSVAQTKSALPPEAERDQKITEMYEIVKKTEAISQIIPQTVDRMIALNAVHRRGNFINVISSDQVTCYKLQKKKYVYKYIETTFLTDQ